MGMGEDSTSPPKFVDRRNERIYSNPFTGFRFILLRGSDRTARTYNMCRCTKFLRNHLFWYVYCITMNLSDIVRERYWQHITLQRIILLIQRFR